MSNDRLTISLSKQLLEEVHTGHPGIVKSKAIARSYIWWPGQTIRLNPSAVATHPRIPAKKLCGRIHIDYAGLLKGVCF